MTTQVFRGRTLDDARKAASEVLGKDAVVLTTRHVRRPGITGLLGGMDCEIAAAVLDPPPPPAASLPKSGPFASSAYVEPKQPASRDPLSALRAELRAEIRAVKASQTRPSASPDELAREIASMRETIEQFAP